MPFSAARPRSSASEIEDGLPVPYIQVADGREALGWLMAGWYGHPSRDDGARGGDRHRRQDDDDEPALQHSARRRTSLRG